MISVIEKWALNKQRNKCSAPVATARNENKQNE
jgi:hypothetical protein